MKITKTYTVTVTEQEVLDLAGSVFDQMCSDLRMYAGGSLTAKDWPDIRKRIQVGMLQIDRFMDTIR